MIVRGLVLEHASEDPKIHLFQFENCHKLQESHSCKLLFLAITIAAASVLFWETMGAYF